jgi:hypothetical protein
MKEKITDTGQSQLSLFLYNVYKNVVICSDGLQDDYIAKP